MHAPRMIALATLLTMTALSCGDSSDDSSGNSSDGGDSSGQPATEEGLADAAAEIAVLLFDDSSGGYRRLSDQCREDVTRGEWVVTLQFASEFFEGVFGFPASDVEVGEVQVRDVTDTSGEASIESISPDGETITPAGEQWESYVYEDGEWRLDECETLGGDFNSDE